MPLLKIVGKNAVEVAIVDVVYVVADALIEVQRLQIKTQEKILEQLNPEIYCLDKLLKFSVY